MKNPPTLIIGDGAHGKDTAAELLQTMGWTFQSSSWHCAEVAVLPYMQARGLKYSSVQECYADRRNHRDLWKDAIAEYNTPKDRIVTEILSHADIYVGLRKRDEFEAAKHHFEHILWIDRSQHLPPEQENDLTKEDAEIVIDNNGTMQFLRLQLILFHKDAQRLQRHQRGWYI